MDRKQTAYRAATGLFCLVMAFSGTSHLMRVELIVEAMTGLGFPLYVMTILGTAKLLGVVALLTPGRPLLKEWAYAGFTFNLLGATASHLFMGDPLSHTIRPFLVLLIGVVSYSLRPESLRPHAARVEVATPAAPAAA